MPTIISHAVAGAAIAQVLAPRPNRAAITAAAAICAMLPDADVIGFRLGIHYGDLLGHRGASHSLLAALAVAAIASIPFWPRLSQRDRAVTFLCLFAATASHAILDAFTNGGMGVAFLAPFDSTRYFFPFTPIAVSPLRPRAFLTARGLSVILSELTWIWLPAACVIALRQSAERGPVTKPGIGKLP